MKLIQTNCENTWKISTMESCRELIRNLKKLKKRSSAGYLQPDNLQKVRSESMKNQQRESARRKALKQNTEHGEKKIWVQEK